MFGGGGRSGGKAEGVQGFLGHAQQFTGLGAMGQNQGRLVPLFVDARKEGNDGMFIRRERDTMHKVAGGRHCACLGRISNQMVRIVENIVPITGATITWVLAKSNKGPAIVTKTTGDGITITDDLGGVFEIVLDPADTAALKGQHYHEGELVDAASRPATVVFGNNTIKEKLI